MIQQLRQKEEVLLYNAVLRVSEAQAMEVSAFLEAAYTAEALGYPHRPPAFNGEAALWAAKTVYIAAQLMLYREHQETDLATMLPPCTVTPTAAAMLSADLCLRFLPDMLVQLKLIDGEDALIPLLESVLKQWHFSGVNYPLMPELENDSLPESDACLRQLYADRIIFYRNVRLARHPAFAGAVAASLGLYASTLWPHLDTHIA